MNTNELVSVVSRLAATDVDAADRAALASFVAELARLRSWLDAQEMRSVRRSRSLAGAGCAETPESMLGRNGGRSGREVATVTERDRVCATATSFESALADGAVSAGHVDALASATKRLDPELRDAFFSHEHLLLAAAGSRSVDAFSRECRDLARHVVASSSHSDAEELDRQRAASSVKQWVEDSTGMCKTLLSLDPLSHARMMTAVNASLARRRRLDGSGVDRTPWQRLQVDAFLDAVTDEAPASDRPAAADATTVAVGADGDGGDAAGDTADGARAGRSDDRGSGPADGSEHEVVYTGEPRIPEILTLVDLRTLESGLHDHSICETDDGTPIPVSTMRRLACDADIIPVVMGADGAVLDAGRSCRTANRSQRRALRAMHRTCAHPDCRAPFSMCKIHHVLWWWRDRGRSDLGNLLPLCERHHHLVHEGGWRLDMTSDRVATWTRPDGTVFHTGSTIDRTPGGVTPPPGRVPDGPLLGTGSSRGSPGRPPAELQRPLESEP